MWCPDRRIVLDRRLERHRDVPVQQLAPARRAPTWPGPSPCRLREQMSRVPVFLCVDLEPVEREVQDSSSDAWRGVDAIVEWLEDLRPGLAEVSGDGRPAPVVPSLRSADRGRVRRAERPHAPVGRDTRASARRRRRDRPPHSPVAVGRGRSELDRRLRQRGLDRSLRGDVLRGVPPLTSVGPASSTDSATTGSAQTSSRFSSSRVCGSTSASSPGARGMQSIAPGERTTGSIPDYTRAPREPYHASSGDLCRPDPTARSGLWIVPLSAANPGSALPLSWRIGRRVRFPFRPSHRPLYMFRELDQPEGVLGPGGTARRLARAAVLGVRDSERRSGVARTSSGCGASSSISPSTRSARNCASPEPETGVRLMGYEAGRTSPGRVAPHAAAS